MKPRVFHPATPLLCLLLFSTGLAAQTNQDDNRAVKLVNNCAEPLWIASQNLAGDPEWFLDGTSTGCTSDAQCQGGFPSQARCNPESQRCEITVPVATNCASCKIWPRTACNFETGFNCPDGVFCCATGGIDAPEPPVTVAEFTFQSKPPKDPFDPRGAVTDFYDVSIIDGVNVAVEMGPTGEVSDYPPTPPDYWCGNPGGTVSNIRPSFDCRWGKVLGEDCDGQPGLRAVEPFFPAKGEACPGSSSPISLPIGDVCSCSGDGDCGMDQICGLGNPQTIGRKLCGTFGGCTTPKALCGVGQYFSCATNAAQLCKTGGESCTEDRECTSGRCVGNVCDESPADFLNCRQKFPRAVTCTNDSDCPALTGLNFSAEQECACPDGTKCVRLDAEGNQVCQMTCDPGTGSCRSMGCEKDDDCVRLTSEQGCTSEGRECQSLGAGWSCNVFLSKCQKDTGTFMLCDTDASSPTFQQCVATRASMLENQGVNGQSCVNPTNFAGCNNDEDCETGTCNKDIHQCTEVKFNAATNLCSGCPTDPRNPLSKLWPAPTEECTKSPTTTGDCDTIGCNNSDWVEEVQPLLASFKRACPPTYTFPFGDVTATFQCRSRASDEMMPNDLDYEIVFCPDRE